MYPNYRKSTGRLGNYSSKQNRANVDAKVMFKYSCEERIIRSTPIRTKPNIHIFFDNSGATLKREPMNTSPINRCKVQSEFNYVNPLSDRGRSWERSTLSLPKSAYENRKEKSFEVTEDQKKPNKHIFFDQNKDSSDSDSHKSPAINRRKYQSEFDYLRSFSDGGRFWEKSSRSSSESSSHGNVREKPLEMSVDQEKPRTHIFFDEDTDSSDSDSHKNPTDNRSKFKSEFDYLRSFSDGGRFWANSSRSSSESSSHENVNEKPLRASKDHNKPKMHFFNENKDSSDSDSQKSPPMKRSKLRSEDDDVEFPEGAINEARVPRSHIFFDDSGNPIGDSFDSTKSYETTGMKTGESDFPDQLLCSQEEMEQEYLEVSRDRELQKYWFRRHNLFKKFDQGIMLDRESWYSVTPEDIASSIADKCRCKVVVDGFCGAGGNTIQFAMTCEKVYAIDIDPVKIAMARHNARIYGVEENITFINGDFFKVVPKLKADIIFLSPPWGGPSYLGSKVFDLETMLSPQPFSKMMRTARKCANRVVAYLPRNSDQEQLLSEMRDESISIVDYKYGRKNIALAAFYNMQQYTAVHSYFCT